MGLVELSHALHADSAEAGIGDAFFLEVGSGRGCFAHADCWFHVSRHFE